LTPSSSSFNGDQVVAYENITEYVIEQKLSVIGISAKNVSYEQIENIRVGIAGSFNVDESQVEILSFYDGDDSQNNGRRLAESLVIDYNIITEDKTQAESVQMMAYELTKPESNMTESILQVIVTEMTKAGLDADMSISASTPQVDERVVLRPTDTWQSAEPSPAGDHVVWPVPSPVWPVPSPSTCVFMQPEDPRSPCSIASPCSRVGKHSNECKRNILEWCTHVPSDEGCIFFHSSPEQTRTPAPSPVPIGVENCFFSHDWDPASPCHPASECSIDGTNSQKCTQLVLSWCKTTGKHDEGCIAITRAPQTSTVQRPSSR
jgi:hypothetical protein